MDSPSSINTHQREYQTEFTNHFLDLCTFFDWQSKFWLKFLLLLKLFVIILLLLLSAPPQLLFVCCWGGGGSTKDFYSFYIKKKNKKTNDSLHISSQRFICHTYIFSAKYSYFTSSCLKQFIANRPIFFQLLCGEASKKLEEKWLPWPSSQSSTPASSILPAQKVPSMPVSWSAQTPKKSPEDYRKDRVDKYI